MKAKIAIITALLCVASITHAQNSVTLGTFGYAKVALPDGFHISGMQFDNTISNSPTTLYGTNLPLNSVVHVFDGTTYDSSTYKSVFVPGSGFVVKWTEEPELPQGQAYWVEASSIVTNTLSGDVPMADATTNTIVNGFQLCSFPYPVDRVVTNLGFTPTVNDVIHVYNGATYDSSTYKSVFVPGTGFVIKWTDETLPISVGEGFWYESASVSDVLWITTRPYSVN